MFNFSKNLLPIFALIISTTTFASSTSNIGVKTKINSGCLVSATDFNFGNINSKIVPSANASRKLLR